jgi:hypothetical protein
VQFIKHLKARNLSPATLSAYVAALVTIARYQGYKLDTTPIVEHLKAARRRAGPPKRAKPLLAPMLKDLVQRLDDARLRICGTSRSCCWASPWRAVRRRSSGSIWNAPAAR